MRKLVLAAVAMATLSNLSACIDMKQDLQVSADGQAVFKIEIAVDAAIIAMQAKNDTPSNFCKGSPPKEGITVTYEQDTERGDLICTITAAGPLDRMADTMQKNSLLPSQDGTAPAATAPTMVILKDGENYRFDVAMKWPQQPPPPENGPDMSKMMLAMFAGRSVSWTITAPSIVETSGKISEDGKTATYSVPLVSLISGDIPEAKFTTTFSTRSGFGLLDWVGGLFGR